MSFGQKKTPGDRPGGISQRDHQQASLDHSSTSSIPHTGINRDVFENELNGLYVVVAQIKSPEDSPRFRRTVYMTLKTAQRAVDRAVMNNREAHLFVARLVIEGGDAQ